MRPSLSQMMEPANLQHLCSFVVFNEQALIRRALPGLLSLLPSPAILLPGPLQDTGAMVLLGALKIDLQIAFQQNKVFVTTLCLQAVFKSLYHITKKL